MLGVNNVWTGWILELWFHQSWPLLFTLPRPGEWCMNFFESASIVISIKFGLYFTLLRDEQCVVNWLNAYSPASGVVNLDNWSKIRFSREKLNLWQSSKRRTESGRQIGLEWHPLASLVLVTTYTFTIPQGLNHFQFLVELPITSSATLHKFLN